MEGDISLALGGENDYVEGGIRKFSSDTMIELIKQYKFAFVTI